MRARPKYEAEARRGVRRYVLVQYVALLVATSALMFHHGALRPAVLGACCLALGGGLVAMGALLEGRSWARPVEIARLAASALAIALVVHSRS